MKSLLGVKRLKSPIVMQTGVLYPVKLENLREKNQKPLRIYNSVPDRI